MRIDIRVQSLKRVNKRFTSVQKFLKNPKNKLKYNEMENRVHNHWILMCKHYFNARSNSGFRTDMLLQQAQTLSIRKNSIIVHMIKVGRKTKGYNSSGGAIRNLPVLLFITGARSSDAKSKNWAGMYYPKWDCRVQTGKHPGISPSTGKRMWKNFVRNVTPDIKSVFYKSYKKVLYDNY